MTEAPPISTAVAVPLDTRELREDVARKAKELGRAAQVLEQAALFDDYPFEEALLLPKDEIRKRYTAEHSKLIEMRQDTAGYMLQIGCPKEHIAALLKMNTRLVEAMAAKSGARVARFSEQFADALLQSAAGDFALADTKKHDANYAQLSIGAGIKVDKAIAIKQCGPSAGANEDPAIDLDPENDNLRRAREFLTARAAAIAPAAQREEIPT